MRAWFTLCLLWLAGAAATPAGALDVSQHPPLVAVVDRLVEDHGFEREQVVEILAGAEIKDSIIKAITRPAEHMPWHRYRKIFMTDARVAGGVGFWTEYREVLERAHQTYGVAPETIVAIIGVETLYGKHRGTHRVLDSLVTLAADYPKRSKFFASELEHFLLLSREQGLDPLTLKGSYAGAVGYPQFISSSYRAYAVDFNGDGKIDLIDQPEDAIGSVANYLHRHGWADGELVVAPEDVASERVIATASDKLKPNQTAAEFRDLGGALPSEIVNDAPLGVVRLETEDAEIYRAALSNFYVITRYNRSILYAMAVYELSREIQQSYRS